MPGHLSRENLGRLCRSRRRLRARHARVAARPWRARRHHGQRLRGVGDLRPRRAVAGSHHLRHLSHRIDLGSQISDARRRRRNICRRKSGVCGQDPGDHRRAAAIAMGDRHRRGGDVCLSAPEAPHIFRDHRARQRDTHGRRVCFMLAGHGARRERPGSGLYRLYVGHHGKPEGSADLARQAPGGSIHHRGPLSHAGAMRASHCCIPPALSHLRS